MSKLIKIIIGIIIINPLNTINPDCIIKQITETENFIHNRSREQDYFYRRLLDFQETIYIKQEIFDKWLCFYNDFENHINNLSRDNKIISANYRLFKWMNITNKKLFRFINSLGKESKQICFELNSFNTDNISGTLRSKYEFSCQTTNLASRTSDINNFFNDLKLRSENLMLEASNFRQSLLESMTQARFENCCCWY